MENKWKLAAIVIGVMVVILLLLFAVLVYELLRYTLAVKDLTTWICVLQ